MDINTLINAIIWLAVVGLIFYVLWWALGKIGLPEPFNKVAKVILAVVAVLLLVNFLLGLTGYPLVNMR